MIYIIIGVFIVLLCALVIRIHYEITHFDVVTYTVYTNKIQHSSRMVFLTDLHDCSYGENNQKLVQAIENANPDMVLIAGDLFTAKGGKKIQTEVAIDLLAQLSKKYPIYYTNGNHETRAKEKVDLYGDAYQDYLNKLKQKKIKYIALNDEKIALDMNGITIAGIELEEEYYKKTFRRTKLPEGYLEKKLGKLDSKQFNILIAHNPSYFDSYAEYGADLVLAGHNHGGIICLPIFGGVISTQYRLFDKYDKGIFFQKNSEMILSAGLGSHTLNIRLWNMPQLIVIDLKKEKN